MHFLTSTKSLSIACLLLQASQATAAISSTCDAQCQNATAAAAAFERASYAHEPLDDFYTIPKSFNSHTKPGDLLRVEHHTDLTNYTVPSSLTMSRIMYASSSLNGTTVPVSAFILWPYAPYSYAPTCNANGPSTTSGTAGKSSKFPMVAWAHGTSGLFPACAPSNYKSLQYNFMVAYDLALEGFAVVATDYAGLGVSTLPNGVQTLSYLAGSVGANDVAYAVEAARKAFPNQFDEDGPFVAMGHSEGGNVIWAFAERQAKTPVPGYMGTVALSAATDIIALGQRAIQAAATTPLSSLPPWVTTTLGLQPLIVAAVTAVFPAYNFSGLTDVAYDRWNNVVKPLQGCLSVFTRAFTVDFDFTQVVRPGWINNTFVDQWRKTTLVGAHKVKGPMLVTMGENDAFPIDLTADSVHKSCALSPGEHIEFQVYKAMQHFPAIQAGKMYRMSWIKDRFAWNAVAGGVCGKQTVFNGFNTDYTVQFTTPNWLVNWVPPNQSWELSF